MLYHRGSVSQSRPPQSINQSCSVLRSAERKLQALNRNGHVGIFTAELVKRIVGAVQIACKRCACCDQGCRVQHPPPLARCTLRPCQCFIITPLEEMGRCHRGEHARAVRVEWAEPERANDVLHCHFRLAKPDPCPAAPKPSPGHVRIEYDCAVDKIASAIEITDN